ncbi:MAG: exodeoxyribonuclease VII small subunit [Collinsella intestinalis]
MAEGSFDEITERLDEIIAQVRSKDTSLERSLDLFDEAIELGSARRGHGRSFSCPARADMLDAELATEAQSERLPSRPRPTPNQQGIRAPWRVRLDDD